MQFSSIQNSKSGYHKCLRIGHWNLNGIISKQFGNKLECKKFMIRSNNLICSGSAKLIYCRKMESNLTYIKIFIRIENMVNAVTTAAGDFNLY